MAFSLLFLFSLFLILLFALITQGALIPRLCSLLRTYAASIVPLLLQMSSSRANPFTLFGFCFINWDVADCLKIVELCFIFKPILPFRLFGSRTASLGLCEFTEFCHHAISRLSVSFVFRASLAWFSSLLLLEVLGDICFWSQWWGTAKCCCSRLKERQEFWKPTDW